MRHARLEFLFLTALEIDSPEQRAAFLQAECGGDGDLRREVERLLRSNDEAGSFLQTPAPELDATIAFSPDSNRTAAMYAGLSPAFDGQQTVVVGKAGLSVVPNPATPIDGPHVAFRDPADSLHRALPPLSPDMPSPEGDGRYRLDGEIARGGMGAILKGRDTHLGRDLAIKVLLDMHKDKPEVVQRFIEEAQIGGQLQHPGIAPVYELGQFADQRPFFSMKLVKGETLAKLLADRPDPSAERGRFVGIFEQICQTVAYAHSRGVIHRDLKPANIMVGAFGEVQVMDWGLAKVLASGAAENTKADDRPNGTSVVQTLRSKYGSDSPGSPRNVGGAGAETQMGSVMGTPAYMPPEQALGEIDSLDERADVFGLGAILCEILTGKPPYVADDGTQVYRLASRGKLTDCFERLAGCNADAELIAIAKQCLERERGDRPRNAGVLAERISTHVRSVEKRLHQAEIERAAEAARARAERRAKQLQLTMAAVVLLLVSLGGIAAFWSAMVQRQLKEDAQRAEKQATDARQAAEQSARREQALAQEAQLLQQRESELRQQAEVREQLMQATLYAAEMNLAGQAAENPSGLRRLGQITANWTPDRATRDLRGWEWHYLESLRHADVMTIDEPHAVCIHWHPDGTRFVTGGRDGFIRIRDAADGRLLSETHVDSPVVGIAWNPQGTRFASASHDQKVRVWDAATCERCAPEQRLGAAVISLCWSPDGQQIAAKAGPNVVISNVATGEPVKRFEVLDIETGVAWHPTLPRLAAMPAVFDITTGAKLWEHRGAEVEWSPNGQRLAAAIFTSAHILSGDDGKVLFELPGHTDGIEHIAWSPAGTELATASRDDTIRIWDAQTGKLLMPLRGHTGWVLGVAWSPEGRRLASIASDGIKLWNWPHRPNPARMKLERTAASEVFWSPDGLTVAAGHGRFGTWNLDSLKPNIVLDLGPNAMDSNFSPTVSWNPAAHLIAGKRNDHSVLFDDRTGDPRIEIPLVDLRLRSLALSPDGTRLATSAFSREAATDPDAGMLRLYDSATGQLLWSVKHPGNSAGSVAWSRDGSRIAVGGWMSVAVVDVRNGELLAKYPGEHSDGWIREIAWSPNGDRVVLAYFNHALRIIDAKHGTERNVLVGHTNEVQSVSWSPDGTRIASGGQDQTVRIWNADSGLQMLVLQGHKATVTSVRWSPDGKALASGSLDGEVLVWDARLDPSRKSLAPTEPTTPPRQPVSPGGPARPEAARREPSGFEASQFGHRAARAAPLSDRSEDRPLTPADIERELNRLASELAAEPTSIGRLHQRGNFFARLGRWREGADDYLRIVKLLPMRRFHWGIAASALVMAGDKAAYEKHCQAMIEQFRDTTEADIADTVCKTALLLPDTVPLADLPIDVLRAGASDPRWEQYRAWFVACCALISYREGQPEAAIDWTKKLPGFDGHPGAMALCVRAMSEFALDRQEAARQSLQEAERRIPLPLRTLGQPDAPGPLPVPLGVADHDWLVAEILRREAAALLK